MNKFEKVSFTQFYNSFIDCFGDNIKKDYVTSIYNNIILPKRATRGSAGYDFFSPIDFRLYPNDTIKIPTGIRVQIDEGLYLGCYPRSGLGFKYRLQLDNTVGIIDSDYYYSDNEGHIFAKITNDSKSDKVLEIKTGTAFMQGVFNLYALTIDDNVKETRNGGFGSTDK